MAGVGSSLAEKEFLARINPYRDQLVTDHPDSPQEGFEYFESDDYRTTYGGNRNIMVEKLRSGGLKTNLGMLKLFSKHMPHMMKGRKECFTDLEPYLDQLESDGALKKEFNPLVKSYPNSQLWEAIKAYALNQFGVRIGFTEIPEQLVFKGKTILFRYAIVCIQEMEKSQIDQAPELPAGEEVIRVYKDLGLAVNDIARWLRHRYGIRCQSNHPLGGLTNTTPLACKAGMGWQGCNGLLITPWVWTTTKDCTYLY